MKQYRKNFTIEELIILHLENNYQNPENYFVSILLTEEGIQSEIGCSLCYISRILKKLEKEGYVYRKIMKIENTKRKHYVFFLTDKGFKLAEKIREKIRIELKV